MRALCDHRLMQISAPCVVSLTWRLEDTRGNLIDELDEPVEFYYGGDDLFASVETALLDQETGFATKLQLEPEQAFGLYDADLVCFEDRAMFPEHLEVGMQFDGPPEGSTTQGMPLDAIYTITEIYPSHVVLDGNHPLAGMALRIALHVRNVRGATAQEIANRSVGNDAVSVLATAPPGSRMQ
jgi:FKBP-type peptidyl-prolyl cis-trans isomerase SlyD